MIYLSTISYILFIFYEDPIKYPIKYPLYPIHRLYPTKIPMRSPDFRLPGPYPFPRGGFDARAAYRLCRNRNVALSIVAYCGHQWEPGTWSNPLVMSK